MRVIEGYGAALTGMEGSVIDMHPKDEIDEYHNYFTVEFRVQETKGGKLYLYNLFRQQVPEECLKLIERWDPGNVPGYTRDGLDQPSPVLRKERESPLRQTYQYEFPNSFVYI